MFATAVRFLAKKGKGKSSTYKPAGMNVGLEGQLWSRTLREIVKERGPLTVASFWEHAQAAGLKSKSHMKIILKWMRGQHHVKVLCNHTGEKRSLTDKRSTTEKVFTYAYVIPKSERVAAQATPTADGSDIPC